MQPTARPPAGSACRPWLVMLVLHVLLCLASKPVLAENRPALHLGQDIGWSLLQDDAGSLSATEIAALPGERFRPQAGAVALGLYRGAVWLRFEVPAHWNQRQELLLRVSPSFPDSVQLFRPPGNDASQQWQAIERGDGLTQVQREFDQSSTVFRIRTPERGAMLLRVQSSSTVLVEAALYTPQSLGTARARSFALLGVYSGVSLLAVILLLFFAVHLRSRPLAAVAVASLVAWLQQLASRGLLAQYLYPDAPDGAIYVTSLLGSGAMAASIWVVREEFTRLGTSRRIDRLVMGLALLTLLSPLGRVFHVDGPVIWLANGLQIFALGLGVMLSLRGWKQRAASALVSALALSLSLFVMVLANLAALGLLPYAAQLLLTWHAANPLALAVVVLVKVLDLRNSYARGRDHQVQALRNALVEGNALQQHLRERTAQLLRAQATLRHALKAEHRLLLEQRQFFAMISHEFRTPLTIVENLAITQERFPSQEEAVQVRRARQIRSATHRLSSLVNNCLVDERLSAGGFVLQAQEVSVADLVNEASELVLLNDHQRVQVDTSAAPQRWRCDPALLRIAISNLVDNAAKYSRRGCIRVAALQIDEDLLVSVSDDGPGVQPADRARIFQAFERGRHADEGGGFGFGLYVTRKIARLHGGDVTMVNSYLGGSVFHLFVPRAPRPAHPLA